MCRHCGTPLPAEIAAGGGEFCSAGCEAVHRRIEAEGLDRYYELKDRTLTPVGGTVFHPRDYAWLEAAARAAEGVAPGPAVAASGQGDGRRGPPVRRSAPPVAELTLDVQGVACVGCVWLVERLFRRRDGALAVDINVVQGRLRLRWRAGVFDPVSFAQELQGFGYLVGPPGSKPAVRAGRALRLRLGLCGALAMNTMLFTLPAYLGLEPESEFYVLFEALSFVFATASLLVGGSHFFQRAWAGLRTGGLSIDLPISLGLLVGYGASVYGWRTGEAALVYFDFVAIFTFLMLVGRWTQEAALERNRQQLLGTLPGPGEVEKVSGEKREATAASYLCRPQALVPGDRYRLRAGGVVPVASRLESAAGEFTTEWINGEPEPRALRAGQTVPAGATSVVRTPVELTALEGWNSSPLARLLAVEETGFRNPGLERVIRLYLAAVLAVAAVGGAAWWIATGDALWVARVVVAVLVVSCPCALGVSWPLVEELTVASARRLGVFVRELTLWSRLRRVRRIFFDKTGTLTLETPVLANPDSLAALSPVARARLAALVRDNPHPVALALAEAMVFADRAEDALPSTGSVRSVPDRLEEVVGHGVRLIAPDGEWWLGKNTARVSGREPQEGRGSPPAAAGTRDAADAVLAHNGRVLAHFRFAEAPRLDARAELAALRRAGYAIEIVSGDRPEKVAALAVRLGLPPESAHGGLDPEQKCAWVAARDRGDSLMLGDGANDSLAFDAATCRGTPVIHRGILGHKSDFYYLGRGLAGVRQLFALAACRRRALLRVFSFAVLYNAGTVTLALAGLVNPLAAAILMPASSLLSLTLTVVSFPRTDRAVR
jgi:Cu2+-exporting ATPase